jgi:CBS domain-containing protein
MELQEILKEAVTVDEHATFREALKTMLKRETNTLLVVGEDGKLVGEVSVSDLMDAVIPEYLDGDTIAEQFNNEQTFKEAVRNAADKEVETFMMVETDPIRIDDTLMTVAGTAIAQRRARIPVVDQNDRPVGIISRRGLKHMLASFMGD